MKINNYLEKFQIAAILKKNSENDKFSGKINELCKQFKQENNLIDIIKIFNKDKTLKMQEASAYYLENYKFIIGTKENIQDYKNNLNLLKKYNISCAPKIEQTVSNKNKQYIMLVMKLPEKESVMKNYTANPNMVDTLAKCQFINELENMARSSKNYNPLITQEPSSIKVTSDGRLYVSDWNEMDKFANDKEQAQYFKQLRKLLNLILI